LKIIFTTPLDECDGAGEDRRECDGKDIIFLRANKDPNKTFNYYIGSNYNCYFSRG
jgi:hypothetical protein